MGIRTEYLDKKKNYGLADLHIAANFQSWFSHMEIAEYELP